MLKLRIEVIEYEESTALIDFKEELLSNLEAHITSLKEKGLNDSDAFSKATTELGDITMLANEISLKKKQEVYETMYMKTTRSYITRDRRAAYITCLGVFLFGVLTSLISGPNILPMIPFGVSTITWATYLLLTQETARLNPIKKGRAIIYGIAVAVLSFGIIIFLQLYSASEFNKYLDTGGFINWKFRAFAVLIPFGLPPILALVSLALTEQSRTKSWVTSNNKE